MSRSGLPCYRNGGCGPYEMLSCTECPASKSDYLQCELEPKPQTNADRIRAMTDEELADFLWSIGSNPLNGWIYIKGKPIFHAGDGNRWLDWLTQEAKDGTQN